LLSIPARLGASQVVELSTPLLAFVDLFRDYPKFAAAYPTVEEVCRVAFAVLFFVVRIVGWLPVVVAFARDALDVIGRDGVAAAASSSWKDADSATEIPVPIVCFWLTVTLFLTGLQWYWATMIGKAAYAMAIGDKSQRENEAKGA